MPEEKDVLSLRKEVRVLLGIPEWGCSAAFKRRFYHLGLSFLPKTMTEKDVRKVIARAARIDNSSEKVERIFQILRTEGAVFEISDFIGDCTTLSLKEVRAPDGKVYYTPSTYNPMDYC